MLWNPEEASGFLKKTSACIGRGKAEGKPEEHGQCQLPLNSLLEDVKVHFSMFISSILILLSLSITGPFLSFLSLPHLELIIDPQIL